MVLPVRWSTESRLEVRSRGQKALGVVDREDGLAPERMSRALFRARLAQVRHRFEYGGAASDCASHLGLNSYNS
jgi:hypothetical protein